MVAYSIGPAEIKGFPRPLPKWVTESFCIYLVCFLELVVNSYEL